LTAAHVCIYLASGGFAPADLHRAPPLDPAGVLPSPDPLCPPWFQSLATPLVVKYISDRGRQVMKTMI